jgi:hypothetical protein
MRRVSAKILLVFWFCFTVPAQSVDERLAKLSNLLKEEISREMPGWSCKSFEPSKGVSIQQWSAGDIGVKIAVVEYASSTTAAERLNEHRSSLKTEEEAARNRGQQIRRLKESLNVGDEGFVWDVRGSDAVVFRKGALLINVSVFSPVNSKDVYFSRKFAALVATALKSHFGR